jgi:hypothetical protein
VGLPDGTTLIEDVTFIQFPVVTTVFFHGFNGLVSVTWQQGPGGFPGQTHQFDNISIRRRGSPQ